MEGLGGSAAHHFHSPSGSPGTQVSGNFTGWHTYAADREPGVVTYFYDGTQVGQITTGITAAPMYIILDYAVSSAVGGPTSVDQTMKVDDVRVWQQSPESAQRARRRCRRSADAAGLECGADAYVLSLGLRGHPRRTANDPRARVRLQGGLSGRQGAMVPQAIEHRRRVHRSASGPDRFAPM